MDPRKRMQNPAPNLKNSYGRVSPIGCTSSLQSIRSLAGAIPRAQMASIVQSAAGPADALIPEQRHAAWLEISALYFMPSSKAGRQHMGDLLRAVDEPYHKRRHRSP